MLNRKLEYLMALAKEGHFARAAAACHVSQPTLSAAIQQLEADLGVPIVKRGQRFHGLTPQGELVLEAAHRMATERERLQQKLRDQRDDYSGTLRVGVLGSAIPLLKNITVPFRQQFPHVNLRVMIQSAVDVLQAFEESSLDVAITYLDQKLRRQCHTHELYTEEYEFLIRKGTAFSGRQSASWEDLRQLPLCLLSPESPIFGTWESEILSETLATTPHIVTNAIWLVMDHVRTGEWASVLPKPVRVMISGDQELEAIPLAASGKPASVAIAIPREPLSPIAGAFFEVATSDRALRALGDLLQSIAPRKSVRRPRPKQRSTAAVGLSRQSRVAGG